MSLSLLDFRPRVLPENPSLDYLKDQAKRLLRELRRQEPTEIEAYLRALHPEFRGNAKVIDPAKLALHDAQLCLARQHACGSWSELKRAIDQKLAAALPWERQLLQSIWRGRLEDFQILLDKRGDQPLPADLMPDFQRALEGIADRSVWHRPQFREIARALLAKGVPCRIWPAARLGLLEVVEPLLDADPSLLTTLDERGRTPLQRAALIYGSDPECEKLVPWLIARGAPIDLHTASAYALPEVVAELLQRDPAQVNAKVQGSAPLNWAVRPRGERVPHGGSSVDLRVCELLVTAGADVETEDDDENGMRPLHHLGEWMGNTKVVDLLLEAGANLHVKDGIGWTPLDYATNRNREEMMAHFQLRGAVLNRVTWDNHWGSQRDAIIAATKRNDIAQVEALLAENADLVLAREESGDTALHWAGHDGHYEIAALLLRHGADVHAQETRYWGGTPLHWASERQPALAQLLLDHGAEVNYRNERTGQTPLHYCARCDDAPEVAELLLARGADPALRDGKGRAPLFYAEQAGHTQVAEVLKRRLAAS